MNHRGKCAILRAKKHRKNRLRVSRLRCGIPLFMFLQSFRRRGRWALTNFLIRRFVAQYQETEKAAVREGYGRLAGLVGIGSNLLLFAVKLLAGLISGSIAIMADGVNNLYDCASSAVTVIAFRLAGEPADKEHPYGHARFEYIGGLVVSCLILVVGFQLILSAVEKIRHPEPVVVSWLAIGILLASMAVKVWQSLFTRKIGGLIQSQALLAASKDSRNDVISTGAVLLAIVAGHLLHWPLDGLAGLAVAVFIIISGVGLVKDSLNPLLGMAPDKELVQKIEARILSHESVVGLHDLVVHNYGAGSCFASVHVELPASQDIMISHDIIDNIEREFALELGVSLVIHLDPVVTDNPKLDAMKQGMKELAQAIDKDFSIHDFRMVEGTTHTNLIFDVVTPPRHPLNNQALREAFTQAVQDKWGANFYCVITIDRSMVPSVE